MPDAPTVAVHFTDRSPAVKATYAKILAAARKLGPVTEEPKKTSIHLVRKSAFAGVATRKTALILTLKADADIQSPRVARREQVSASRWHHEVRLETPEQVDRGLVAWMTRAWDLSG